MPPAVHPFFMLFDSWFGILRVLLVSVAAYAALIAVLLIAGKRSLAKLNAFDLVVTVALGSTLATVLLSKDIPLAEGVLAFALLAGLQYVVAWASIRSGWFRRLIRSEPSLLLRDGRFLEDRMRQERVTRGEVEQAIRKAGIGRIEEVAAVVLESDGGLSVIRCEGNGEGGGRLSALGAIEERKGE